MGFRAALNLGLLVVCVLAAVAQFRSTWRQADLATRTDPVERFDLWLRPLRPHLDGVASVSYVPRPDGESIEDTSRLFLTQYALAPTLVQETTTPRHSVSRFRSAEEQEAYLSAHPVRIVIDLGGGVMLLDRQGR
jgi:hypothetical protein